MNSLLKHFPTETVELVKADGRRFGNITARVNSAGIRLEDTTLPVEEGDLILRPLPNGLTERFVVVNSGFQPAVGRNMPARFLIEYKRETAVTPEKLEQTITQHFHGSVGNVANGGSNFQQSATINPVGQQLNVSFDPAILRDELNRLRSALRIEAEEPEQYEALSELAHAEKALALEDKPKTIDHLKAAGLKAGPWLLNASTTIGTTVAAEVIKSLLKLPGN